MCLEAPRGKRCVTCFSKICSNCCLAHSEEDCLAVQARHRRLELGTFSALDPAVLFSDRITDSRLVSCVRRTVKPIRSVEFVDCSKINLEALRTCMSNPNASRFDSLTIASVDGDLLGPLMPNLTSLTSLCVGDDLDFHGYYFRKADALFRHLATLTALQNLTLCHSDLGQTVDGIDLLCSTLNANTGLRSLSLSFNGCSSDQIDKVVRALSCLTHLATFSLMENTATDACASSLCGIIVRLTSLESVEFVTEDDGFSSASTTELFHAARAMSNLKKLSIIGLGETVGISRQASGEVDLDEARQKPLIFAAGLGDVEEVRRLIKSGVSANDVLVRALNHFNAPFVFFSSESFVLSNWLL